MSESSPNSVVKKAAKYNFSSLVTVVVFANFGSLLFGYEIGATIWVIFCFEEYSTDDNNAAYSYYRYAYNHSLFLGFIAASTALGAVVCYSLLLKLGDDVSKKDEMLLASSLYFVASLLISVSGELTWDTALPLVLLVAGKFIYGGGIASTLHSIPQYITEILPADIRGQYGSSVEFMVMLGLNIGYWVGYANDYWGSGAGSWVVSFRVAYLISLGMAIAALFIPHNPVWMLYHDLPDEEVLKALQFITPTADEEDVQRMKNAVLEERKQKVIIDERLAAFQRDNPDLWLLRSGMYDLLTPSLKLIGHDRLYRRCLVVKFTFNIFKIFSGQSVFLYYALTLFTDLGVANPEYFVFAYLLARLVTAFLMVFIAEKLGRRDFLLLSSGVMAGSLFLAAIFNEFSIYAAVAMMFVSGLAFQLGFGSMAYFVLNEITPFYIRSTANAVANIMLFTAYFIVTFLFPTMLKELGFLGIFIFFAVCNLIALYFVYYYVPETRGVELEKCYRLVDEMCDTAPDLSIACKPCCKDKETGNQDEQRSLVE